MPRHTAIVVLFICIGISILRLAEMLNLSPDASNYLTASSHLVHEGRLEVFTNWPSHSLEPVKEHYTEYPPGFPIYLAPFMLLFENPVHAAFAAQSMAIIFFFWMLFQFSRTLHLGALNQIGLFLCITFLETFVCIQSDCITEVLFIALSLGVGFCAIQWFRSRRLRYWWLGLVLCFLSSSLKWIGIANFAWFIALGFQRQIFFIHEHSQKGFLRIVSDRRGQSVLIIAGIIIVFFSLYSDRLSSDMPKGMGIFQLLTFGFGIIMIFVGILAPKWKMDGNDKGSIPLEDISMKDRLISCIGIPFIFSSAPILLWIIRNRFLYGMTTSSHHLFGLAAKSNLLAPWLFLGNVISVHHVPTAVVLLVLLAIVCFTWLVASSEHVFVLYSLLIAAVGFLLIVWVPSLFSRFDSLGDRLLSPFIVIGIIGLFYCIHVLWNRFHSVWIRGMLVAFPVFFLLLGRHLTWNVSWPPKFAGLHPPEQGVWRQIQGFEFYGEASHFYSEYRHSNFRYQIFSGIPHRILWESDFIKDPGEVRQLLSKGSHPFFLFHRDSKETTILDSLIVTAALPLVSMPLTDPEFVLYHPSGRTDHH